MSMCEIKLMTTKQQQYYGNKKKKKKIQQAPHKHNHTKIPNLMWKTLQYKGKNHGVAPKNIHYEIEITTIKFMLNLSSQ